MDRWLRCLASSQAPTIVLSSQHSTQLGSEIAVILWWEQHWLASFIPLSSPTPPSLHLSTPHSLHPTPLICNQDLPRISFLVHVESLNPSQHQNTPAQQYQLFLSQLIPHPPPPNFSSFTSSPSRFIPSPHLLISAPHLSPPHLPPQHPQILWIL